jgi:hypothetical protein
VVITVVGALSHGSDVSLGIAVSRESDLASRGIPIVEASRSSGLSSLGIAIVEASRGSAGSAEPGAASVVRVPSAGVAVRRRVWA